jgi:cytochrome c oxidase assembly protein subunit 15
MTAGTGSRKLFFNFQIFSLVYCLAVILWGAYVRATGSGAGCGDHWPLCNGQVIPTAPKVQTVIEFAHRLSSGLSLVWVVISFVWARRISDRHSLVRAAARWSLIAIVLEALLGAGLVLLKLVEFDQSVARAVSIALHLVNTMFLLACLTSTLWLARNPGDFESPPRRFLPRDLSFWFSAGLFLMLGMSGAVTALGDTLFPAKSLAAGIAADFDQNSHFTVRLRILHPILATLWIGSVFYWSRKLEAIEFNRVRNFLLGGVILQFLLGLLNWILMAPNWMQLVHLLVADLVFIALWISGITHETRKSRF